MEEGSAMDQAGEKKAVSSSSVVAIRGEDAEKSIGETMTRAEGSRCCRSWVVEMERMLECTLLDREQQQWKQHSIYRVPEYIKNMTNRSAYRPWLVSLGPFHHGEPDLLPMEEHKRRAVLHLVKRSGKSLEDFVAAVEEVADELMDAYNELDGKWRQCKDRFVEMMVTDGCFMLEILRMLFYFDQKDYDYAPNDPVFSERGLSSLYLGLRSDMVVMENQVPLLLLQRIASVAAGEYVGDEEL